LPETPVPIRTSRATASGHDAASQEAAPRGADRRQFRQNLILSLTPLTIAWVEKMAAFSGIKSDQCVTSHIKGLLAADLLQNQRDASEPAQP
jgi:hypothetical protein